MRYQVISADCHLDLIWLPPDLFTGNASHAMKDRMPYVTDGPDGKVWVTKRGSSFGLMNGMGNTSGIVGPILTGWIVDSTGSYLNAFYVAAGLSLLGGLWWAFAIPAVRPIALE